VEYTPIGLTVSRGVASSPQHHQNLTNLSTPHFEKHRLALGRKITGSGYVLFKSSKTMGSRPCRTLLYLVPPQKYIYINKYSILYINHTAIFSPIMPTVSSLYQAASTLDLNIFVKNSKLYCKFRLCLEKKELIQQKIKVRKSLTADCLRSYAKF
jgi:hypothetical protein